MPQSFASPGAAATNSLFDFLREREASRRQAMLDEMTQTTAARQDEVARGALDVQREQMEGLREQPVGAADLNREIAAGRRLVEMIESGRQGSSNVVRRRQASMTSGTRLPIGHANEHADHHYGSHRQHQGRMRDPRSSSPKSNPFRR